MTNALAERLRKTGAAVALGGEAVWGLDLESARTKSATAGGLGSGTRPHTVSAVTGVPVHRPEAARNYLLKSFATAAPADGEAGPAGAASPAKAAPRRGKKAKTQRELEAEKEENLGLVLGAIRLLLDSWADHLTPAELDRRTWGWYVAARPAVDAGPAGWGAKGRLRLGDIVKLRRSSEGVKSGG